MQKAPRIPRFKQYFPSRSDLSKEQSAFYETWLAEWKNRTAITVDGQISYLFLYLYSLLDLPPRQMIAELEAVQVAYKCEPTVARACSGWISDCYIMLGDYARALERLPKPALGSTASSLADSILSLRLAIGRDVDAEALLALAGPRVTAFGRRHLPQVARFLEIQLEQRVGHGQPPLLPDWARDSHSYTYFVFANSSRSRAAEQLTAYSFSLNPRALSFAAEQTRRAENMVRADGGLSAVGEGWVSETELYYQLVERLRGVEVLQHSTPEWLRGQHLDVYMPSLAVAVEFQGIQHDRPVDYFGGEEAFRQLRRRDAAKKHRCTRNGVLLIEVRPGYSIDELIANILRAASAASASERSIDS